MAAYRYRAMTAAGGVISGAVDAPNEAAVIQHIRQAGHYPISATPRAQGGLWSRLAYFVPSNGPSLKALSLATQELAALLQAGLELDRALGILVELRELGSLREPFRAVRARNPGRRQSRLCSGCGERFSQVLHQHGTRRRDGRNAGGNAPEARGLPSQDDRNARSDIVRARLSDHPYGDCGLFDRLHPHLCASRVRTAISTGRKIFTARAAHRDAYRSFRAGLLVADTDRGRGSRVLASRSLEETGVSPARRCRPSSPSHPGLAAHRHERRTLQPHAGNASRERCPASTALGLAEMSVSTACWRTLSNRRPRACGKAKASPSASGKRMCFQR